MSEYLTIYCLKGTNGLLFGRRGKCVGPYESDVPLVVHRDKSTIKALGTRRKASVVEYVLVPKEDFDRLSPHAKLGMTTQDNCFADCIPEQCKNCPY